MGIPVTPIRSLTIEHLRESARSMGGECLSESYLGRFAKHRWRCAKGHEWEALANPIRRGSWCPACAGLRRQTIDDLHAVAAARGGVCLSEHYVGKHFKYLWRCAEGHEWESTYNSVNYNGAWCPRCAALASRLGLGVLQTKAQERGGDCISNIYLGSNAKHQWRCARGHVWAAVANRVMKGSWCPTCRKENRSRIKEK